MGFTIYPDAATATALGKPAFTPVGLANGEAMAAFTAVAEHVGPDLAGDDQPTTFLRFAFSGADIAPNARPRVELIANSPRPGPVTFVDPNVAVSPATAAALTGEAGAVVASAWFEPPYTANVYAMKVAIRRPGTTLSLRIANTTGVARDVVWVAADNPAETQQPWLHATLLNSATIAFIFETQAGSTQRGDPMRITNFGTGPATITGTSPPVATPFFLEIQSATVGPNTANPASARLRFEAPATAGTSGPTSVVFTTANKIDPGPFGMGHNLSFSFSGRSIAPPPGPPVPDLIGKFNADAIAAIHEAGFVARILGRALATGDGSCVKQRPAAGTFLERGERVRAFLGAPVVADGQVLHDDILGTGSPALDGDNPNED